MTLTTTTSILRGSDTSAPILDVLADRWSPRSFDPDAVIDDQTLASVLEAARWCPSASNTQPWRYIVARRGSDAFDKVAGSLMGFNSVWAAHASVLLVALAETVGPDGKELKWARYDVGQSVAHLSIQAQHEGLHVHQMGGFVTDTLRESFALSQTLVPLTVTALGVLAAPEALGVDKLIDRETAARERSPLAEMLLVDE